MMHLGESFDLLARVLRRRSQFVTQEGAIPERSLLSIFVAVVDLSNSSSSPFIKAPTSVNATGRSRRS